jgi:hypothetical protein
LRRLTPACNLSTSPGSRRSKWPGTGAWAGNEETTAGKRRRATAGPARRWRHTQNPAAANATATMPPSISHSPVALTSFGPSPRRQKTRGRAGAVVAGRTRATDPRGLLLACDTVTLRRGLGGLCLTPSRCSGPAAGDGTSWPLYRLAFAQS